MSEPPRHASFRMIVCAALVSQTGRGSVAVCARRAPTPVSENCVAENVRKGEPVRVRTADGLTHSGYFIRLDTSPDSTTLVMSEFESRSGRQPVVIAFNLANIDSVSKERGLPIPEPLMTVVGVAAIATAAAFTLFILSFRGVTFGS